MPHFPDRLKIRTCAWWQTSANTSLFPFPAQHDHVPYFPSRGLTKQPLQSLFSAIFFAFCASVDDFAVQKGPQVRC